MHGKRKQEKQEEEVVLIIRYIFIETILDWRPPRKRVGSLLIHTNTRCGGKTDMMGQKTVRYFNRVVVESGLTCTFWMVDADPNSKSLQ